MRRLPWQVGEAQGRSRRASNSWIYRLSENWPPTWFPVLSTKHAPASLDMNAVAGDPEWRVETRPLPFGPTTWIRCPFTCMVTTFAMRKTFREEEEPRRPSDWMANSSAWLRWS